MPGSPSYCRWLLALGMVLGLLATPLRQADAADVGWRCAYYNSNNWGGAATGAPFYTESFNDTTMPVEQVSWGDASSDADGRRAWPWNAGRVTRANNDNVSSIMTGSFTLPGTAIGTYVFVGRCDDQLYVSVDGRPSLAVNAYTTTWQRSPVITLQGGKAYNIQIHFSNGGGGQFYDLRLLTSATATPAANFTAAETTFPAGTTFGAPLPIPHVITTNATNIADNISSILGEDVTKAFDGVSGSNITTNKWLATIPATAPPNSGFAPRVWANVQFPEGRAHTISTYQWVTGNDAVERDPVSWRLLGSNDARNWTLLDTQTDYAVTTTRGATIGPFAIATPGCYAVYRFEVYKVRAWGDDRFQMRELVLNDINANGHPIAPTVTPGSMIFNANAGSLTISTGFSVAPQAQDGGVLSYEWHVMDAQGAELGDAAFNPSRNGANPLVTVATAGTYYGWVLVRSTNGASVVGTRYPTLDNLARNKPVTFSVEFTPDREAVKAVDGDLTTRWSAGTSNDGEWLQVDLGAVTFVDRVAIQWHGQNYHATRFQVQGAVNASDWMLMAEVVNTAETGQDLNRSNGLTPAAVRYIRVKTLNRNAGGTSIAELHVNGPGQATVVSGTAVSQDQPAFASQSALNFPGGNTGVVMPDVSADAFGNGLTFAAWVRPTNITIGRRVFQLGNATDGALGADGIALQLNGTSLSLLVANAAGTTIGNAATNRVIINAWNHVAAVVNPGSGQPVAIYLNGEAAPAATANLSAALPAAARKFRLGTDLAGGNPFEGQMREVRIWNRPLTAGEIHRTMVTPLTGTEPGLVGWYQGAPRPVGDLTLPNQANSAVLGHGTLPTSITYTSRRTVATDATVAPFSGIEVVDRDTTGAPDPTLGYTYAGTITLNHADAGTLTGTGLTAVSGSPGVYAITGAGRTTFQANLQSVVFTPNPALQTSLAVGQRATVDVALSFGDGHATGVSTGQARIEVLRTGTATGLTAQWWKNTAFTGEPVLTTTVNAFNPVPLFPASLGTTENIALRMTGVFIPNFSGAYKFMANYDDSIKVWIDGVQINWASPNINVDVYSSTIVNLTSGAPVSIRVDFTQGGGGYKLVLRLQRQSDNQLVDFGSNLYPIDAVTLPIDQPPFCNLQAVHVVGGRSAVRLPTFRSTAPVTVEAWVRHDRLAASDSDIFFMRANDGITYNDNRNLRMRIGWTGNVVLSVDTQGSTPTNAATLLDGEWNHLAAVFRPTDPRGILYRNGVVAASSNMALDSAAETTPAVTGEEMLLGYGTSSGPMRGSLADIRVWRIERTATEIRDSMTRPLTGTEPGLAAWYLRSDDLGATLTDESGNDLQSGSLGAATLELGANITIPQVGTNVAGEHTVRPFEDLVLVDPDSAAALTATYNYTVGISLDNPEKGVLTGSANLQARGPGGRSPYEIQVLGIGPAQTILRSLVFTPANGRPSEDVVVTMTINDGHATTTPTYRRTIQVSARNQVVDQPPFISLPAVYMGSRTSASNTPYGDHVHLPTIPLGPEATVELWVKTDGLLPNWCRLVEMTTRRDSNNDAFRLMSHDGRGWLRFTTYNWGSRCSPSDAAEYMAEPFPLNQWTHLAMVVDNATSGATATLYANGAVSTSYAMWPNLSTADRTIAYLGRAADGQRYFQGWMKDVRIWNTARTQTQIRSFMTRPVDAATPNLIGYYQTAQLGLDGKVLIDSSTTRPVGNATLVNNASFTGMSTVYDDRVAQPFAELELLDPDTADTDALSYVATITQQDAAGVLDAAQALGDLSGGGSVLASGTATITQTGLAALQASLQAVRFTPANVTGAPVVANFHLAITVGGQTSVGRAALNIIDRGARLDQPPFISLSAVRCATYTTGATVTPAVVDLPTISANAFAGNQATLECWAKTYEPRSGWARFVSLGINGQNTSEAIFTIQRGDDRGFQAGEVYSGNTSRGRTDSVLTLPTSQWVHLASVFTRNATPNTTLYRNGEVVATGALSGNLPTVALNACRLGLSPTNADQLRGEISDVRIWNVARTQTQIQDGMTRGVVPATANLLGWYRLGNNTLTNDATSPEAVTFGKAVGNDTATLVGATLTGNRPAISLGQICQPFEGVELVDPDSGPAATAAGRYNVAIAVVGNGRVRDWNSAWVANLTLAPNPITGLVNVQTALRSVEFRSLTGSGDVSTVTVTITDLDGGGTSQGTVTMTVNGTAASVDQPTFCSLSAIKMDSRQGIARHIAIPAFTENAPMTVEAWAKISQPTLGTCALWDMGQVSAENVVLRMVGSGPLVAAWASKVSPAADFTSAVPVELDVWRHYAAVYEAAQERLYINGAQVYSRALSGIGDVLRSSARFGSSNADSNVFYREMKDLRIWSTARTAQEIHDYMSRPVTGAPGLLAQYLCHETAGTTLANTGGSIGDVPPAQLVGSPEFTGASVAGLSQTIRPFASAELVDPDSSLWTAETEWYAIDITIDAAGTTGAGVLSNDAIVAYGISEAQEALRAVTFTPSQDGVVNFTITIDDNRSAYDYTSKATCYVTRDQPLFCNLPAMKFTTDASTGTAAGDYITLPTIDAFGDVTLEAWVKADYLDRSARLFDLSSNGTNRIMMFALGSEQRWRMYFQNGGTTIADTNMVSGYPMATWMHLAQVFNSGVADRAATFYMNGQVVAQAVPTADLAAPTATRANCWLGRTTSSGDNERYFRGEMKDFRIWNVARTQTEILGNLTAPVARDATGLLVYYPSAYYDGANGLLTNNAMPATGSITLANLSTATGALPGNAAGNATLMNQMKTNASMTISTPSKIFAAADFHDPDTSDDLTATYTYAVRIMVKSDTNGVSPESAGTLSGLGLTNPSAGYYLLTANGLDTMQDRLRNLVFTPSPQATTAHVWFELSIDDGVAKYIDGRGDEQILYSHGRVDISIPAGSSYPPVPTRTPYLTGLNGREPVATVGWTLVCNPGTWADLYNPGQAAVTTFTYQWYRLSRAASGAVTSAVIAGATAQNYVVTDDDALYGQAYPINSLICQVTATSTVSGLSGTAWSDAIEVNKFGVLTIDNPLLTVTPNGATHLTLTLDYTGAAEAGNPGFVAANDLAFEWSVIAPTIDGSGFPRIQSTWTAVNTVDVALNRTGLYQFRVKVYARRYIDGTGAIYARGRMAGPYENAPYTVAPVAASFVLTSGSTAIPQGGRLDLSVSLTNQFGQQFQLPADRTIRWSVNPPIGTFFDSVAAAGNKLIQRLQQDLNDTSVVPSIPFPAGTAATVTARLWDLNTNLEVGTLPATYTNTWNLIITTGRTWKINFQPATAPVIPTGWYTDAGHAFGARAAGPDGGLYNYGWVLGPGGGIGLDRTTAVRDRNDLRNSSPSLIIDTLDNPDTIRQLYDTCIHTQRLASSDAVPVVYGEVATLNTDNARWQIQVPNGDYTVQLICGDVAYTNSYYDFLVNGIPVSPSGLPIVDGNLGLWKVTGEVPVTVTGGLIYIVNGPLARNNKLCGVYIQQTSVANN